jgi:AcrR family transcriptional regulator
MALYRHVRNKDDLLDALATDLTTPMGDFDAGRGSWRTRLTRLLLAYRALLLAHPALTALLASRAVMTEPSLRFREQVIGLLREGGHRGRNLTRAYSSAIGFTVGFTNLEAQGVPIVPGAVARRADLTVDADAYPHLAAFTRAWTSSSPGGYFEFGLDALLSGLERRAR